MFTKLAAFRKISKFWSVDFFFPNVLVPLGVLVLYLVSFSWLIPDGVNGVFVSRSWKYLLLLTAGLYLIFFVIFKLKRVNKITIKNPIERFSASDFILLLLPLTPVVQYILNNQDILSLLTSLYVLVVFALFSAIFIVAIPILLGVIGSARTLMILGLAFTFTITNMAALSRQFSWFESGVLKIQLTVFGGVFVVSWLLSHLNYKKLLYLLVAVYFVTNSVIQLTIPPEESSGKTSPSTSDNKLLTLVDSRKPVNKPNIYLLLYDAYAPNETMLTYGIDNSPQEEYLKELGFKIYPHTYSVGAASIGTMSRVLNSSTEYYGNTRRGVSGDGVVQNLLKSFGYKTYGVFPSNYFFRGVDYSYDFSFPKPSPSTSIFLEAIFMGEFRFDVEFNEQLKEQFLTTKLGIFEEDSKDPRFIYTHTNVPAHSQNSGACLPNETELFKGRLVKANLEMRQDLETITRDDPKAIVIVAGDHGPYLTKNCTLTGKKYDISEISRLDIQDRFGTFLAIKWPKKYFEKYDDITVLQDLFPSVFSFLFKDGKMLEAKVEPTILEKERISGASVKNGIIRGGIDDGEPLFIK